MVPTHSKHVYQIGSLPHGSGWKFQKYLNPLPRIRLIYQTDTCRITSFSSEQSLLNLWPFYYWLVRTTPILLVICSSFSWNMATHLHHKHQPVFLMKLLFLGGDSKLAEKHVLLFLPRFAQKVVVFFWAKTSSRTCSPKLVVVHLFMHKNLALWNSEYSPLPRTLTYPLKIDGWKTSFLLGFGLSSGAFAVRFSAFSFPEDPWDFCIFADMYRPLMASWQLDGIGKYTYLRPMDPWRDLTSKHIIQVGPVSRYRWS